MSQKQKEKELKNLMILEKHIEEDIKNTRLRFDILCLAADMCEIRIGILKEELRVK